MHKWAGMSAAIVAVLAIGVPVAFGELVPNRSIADIELRMTRAEVVDAAGEPDRERVSDHEIIGRQRMMRYGKTKVLFGGKHKAAEVITLVTKDRSERTRRNVGIGSRKRVVKRRVDGVRCKREFGIHHCFKGRWRAGKRVTDFLLNKRNRVKLIAVAIVID